MSDKNKTLEKEKETPRAQVEVTNIDEPAYERDDILRNASAFSVSRELMAGALRLSDKKQLTKKEIKDLIQKFKKRGV